MSEEWIFRCWDYRDDVAVSANDEHLVMSNELVLSVIVAFRFGLRSVFPLSCGYNLSWYCIALSKELYTVSEIKKTTLNMST